MKSDLKLFKKEITIQIESGDEKNVNDVVQRVKNIITPVYYGCDTRIIEGKMVIKNEVAQIKTQIEYCESKLEELRRDKGQYLSVAFQRSIDRDIINVEDEIRDLKNALRVKGGLNNES